MENVCCRKAESHEMHERITATTIQKKKPLNNFSSRCDWNAIRVRVRTFYAVTFISGKAKKKDFNEFIESTECQLNDDSIQCMYKMIQIFSMLSHSLFASISMCMDTHREE